VDGSILHAEFLIGDQVVMFGDPDDSGLFAQPQGGKTTIGLHLVTDDNRALFDRAVAAGAEPVTPVMDMFYGASSGIVRDPYGRVWVLLTQIVEMPPSPQETERLGREALARGKSQAGKS
jgi:PhnB protein